MTGRVPKAFRSAGYLLVALSIPIVPFVALGGWMEPAAEQWLRGESNSGRVAIAVVGLVPIPEPLRH